MNEGLGDDAKTPGFLRFDDEGNMYLHAGRDLYVMRAAATALRGPQAVIRVKAPERDWARDLLGRRVEGKRAAFSGWKGIGTAGNR